MSNKLRRAILSVLTAVVMILGIAQPAQARAWDPWCKPIDRVYKIQEGNVAIAVMKVDVTGQICVRSDQLFSRSKTDLNFDVSTTNAGTLGMYVVSLRGVTRKKNSLYHQRWRVYIRYNVCLVKVIPWCGPGDPRFYFDMKAKITDTVWLGMVLHEYGGLRRTTIYNHDAYSKAKWR